MAAVRAPRSRERAVLQSAIETIARAEGITHVQALTRIAEIALATVAAGGPERGSAAKVLHGDERAAILIHLDAAAVPGEPTVPGEAAAADQCSAEHAAPSLPPGWGRRPFARIADGPGLPDRVVTRLLCSGRIRTVLRDGEGSVLDLGRSRRLVSAKQFRALLLRDGACTHPGCGSHDGLEAHHVRHWLWGGRTDLANLVLLCARHHHALHDAEFTIRSVGRQRFAFYRADGRRLPERVDPAEWRDTDAPVDDEHPEVAPAAATTRWDGRRLASHPDTVAGLAQHLTRATAGARSRTRAWPENYDPWAA